MDFLDIASIVFVCTAANHLGLIPAIESFIKRRIPVLGCIKCLTFWGVLTYCFTCYDTIAATIEEAPRLLAISFLSAWSAIWLDLFMGIIDKFYLIIYEQIYPTEHEADTDALSADNTVPDVPGKEGCDGIAAND
jgi:hypothetical protein